VGATICGGGASAATNRVTADFGTVGGGQQQPGRRNCRAPPQTALRHRGRGRINTASGYAATVGGGCTTPPAATAPPWAGARTTPPAATTPPWAGAWTTPPAAAGPPWAGARATPPAAGLATVGGGLGNTASGDYATVGGGGTNIASGFAATVGGGAGQHRRRGLQLRRRAPRQEHRPTSRWRLPLRGFQQL
jgi:hypothetical protein